MHNLENMTGCLPDPVDDRDFKLAASPMGIPEVDFSISFSVREPIGEDQGSSDACVAYASSYYHETLKPEKRFSRRDLFCRIALDYGAYLRDGMKAIVEEGQATKDEVSDPVNPDPSNMRDKTGTDPIERIDDKETGYFAIPSNDINACAYAIKNYNGCLFGVNGTNKGWTNQNEPRPPQEGDGAVWGHALFGRGYHLHNGVRCIIAQSSWCGSGNREHHIKEDYFLQNQTFNPWVLIPRKEETMKLINDNGTIYIVGGINNKFKIGVADPETLALFGDEPVESGSLADIPESYTISKGFILNKK